MKIDEQLKLFNDELVRLKKLIPGLLCSPVYMSRNQPNLFVGYVDDSMAQFAVVWAKENPKVLARHILIEHEELVHRLNRNIKALKETVDE